MRVIAGSARRIPLVCPEGKDTRPTTDRIKETLFNIIQNDIYGCEFLDLFSGSGAIGIEALSRGAKAATFVEFGKEAIRCIETNLQKTRLKEPAVVFPVEVSYAISKLSKQGKSFDIIYADPPYNKGHEAKILETLKASQILKEDSLVVIEMSLETNIDFVDEEYYEIDRIKEYKTNKHLFVRRR